MAKMPGTQSHSVIIPAFFGEEIRLYEISLVLTPDGKQYFRYTRHVANPRPGATPRTPRLAIAGSDRRLDSPRRRSPGNVVFERPGAEWGDSINPG